MNKLLTALLVVASTGATAQDNWTSANGEPVKNSTELCWRNANWTPATAHPDCDGALKVQPRVTATLPAPTTPKATPAPAPTTPKATPAPAQVISKVTYSADALFDFDKSVIKPAGKATLDDLIAKVSKVKLEVIIVVGHTDSVGSDSYNIKLGQRRADAVKAYLISKGVEKNRVFTESKGEKQPVADNKTKEGRAKNRRVELEVVGTK
jgi:OOP family OmpA-OmpF porin